MMTEIVQTFNNSIDFVILIGDDDLEGAEKLSRAEFEILDE